MRCPNCGNQLDADNYCFRCMEFIEDDKCMDFDSMINNGAEICLNCIYWDVSPYGSSHGMICRKGNFSEGPGDSCFDFSKEIYLASYGDNGQYQFDETSRKISNKLFHWRNSR